MAGKRKSRAGTSKQVTPEPEDTQSSSLPEDMWIAEAILDQRGKGTQVEYCIHWAGVDPDTGKPWSPTWQRRADCTVPLLDEWETKKSADPGIVGRYRREQEKLKKVGKGKRKRSTISSSVVPSHTRECRWRAYFEQSAYHESLQYDRLACEARPLSFTLCRWQ